MKMEKIKNYALIVLVVFLLIAVGMWNHYQDKYKEQKVETDRAKHNYKVAQDTIKLITGENGLLSSRIEAQELTIGEIKTYCQNITADIVDMKIQLRKVTGITAFNTETTNHINTFFRKDSTRINEVALETLSYSDRWFDIEIKKEGLKANVTANSRDSLIQVIHWQRTGKFWPTKWLTRRVYEQDIKSMNPNSRITYAKWIVPYKRE
jgi:hypothetical protein